MKTGDRIEILAPRQGGRLMIGGDKKKPSRPKLDEIASVDEQNAWLKSRRIESVTPIREPPILTEGPYDQRLRLLLEAPEWPTFKAFLRGYIENSIFRPFETESSKTQNGWWTLTLAKGAASVQINVWRHTLSKLISGPIRRITRLAHPDG